MLFRGLTKEKLALEKGKIREWNADGCNGRLDNPTVANCQSPHQDPDQDRLFGFVGDDGTLAPNPQIIEHVGTDELPW